MTGCFDARYTAPLLAKHSFQLGACVRVPAVIQVAALCIAQLMLKTKLDLFLPYTKKPTCVKNMHQAHCSCTRTACLVIVTDKGRSHSIFDSFACDAVLASSNAREALVL